MTRGRRLSSVSHSAIVKAFQGSGYTILFKCKYIYVNMFSLLIDIPALTHGLRFFLSAKDI